MPENFWTRGEGRRRGYPGGRQYLVYKGSEEWLVDMHDFAAFCRPHGVSYSILLGMSNSS